MTHQLVVTNGTVVTAEQGVFRADVAADDGVITDIAAPGTLSGETTVDATGKHVLPGAIDPHTHHGIYRPFAEDCASESRSGLVGGITTIGNMLTGSGRGQPWPEFLPDLVTEAEANYRHDFFFILGPLADWHVPDIPWAVEEMGITGFKWYNNRKLTLAQGYDVDREHLLEDLADEVIKTLAGLETPTTLGFHSENVEITQARNRRLKEAGADGYEALVDGFPGYAEAQSMVTGSALARMHDYDDSFYAVHISSGRTADELAALRAAGYRTTGETCPHYLTLTAAEADDRAKVNPPVRGADDRERLWARVADGTITSIGTDHCANVESEKVGDTIWDSLYGFPSSSTMLPLILSEGVLNDRIDLPTAVAITSTNTAKTWGLYPKKGTIRIGSDADLAVVDLEKTETVTTEYVQSAADYNLYEGRSVTGWPTQTIVRGTLAYDDGEVLVEPGHGSHIERPV